MNTLVQYHLSDGVHVRRSLADADICVVRIGGRITWKQYDNLTKEEAAEIAHLSVCLTDE